MLIQRKQFLQLGSLATASMMLPKFLKAFEKPAGVPAGNKVLVVLQLSGGNDGLNTVIPIRNDIYHRSRPSLAIDKTAGLMITDDVALHQALPAFKSLYEEGNLSILNNVGYPNPDRSHFRSMDIWQTGASGSDYLRTGWLGRYLDAQCHGCDMPTQALEMDDMLSLALKGDQQKGIALKDPQRLYNTSRENYFRELLKSPTDHAQAPVDYLYKTMAETVSSAEYIYRQSKMHAVSTVYPKTTLGKDFQTIASLICSDINTRVYYLSLGSFDTHVNQHQQQQRLFTEMNDAVSAFVADLKSNHRFEDVLLCTFSEFGRRVEQNASGGTDHGTANNMFLISGGLKRKGILNEMPKLDHLDDGDLIHGVDFKDVYATMLRNWLGADDRLILGKQFSYLDFV